MDMKDFIIGYGAGKAAGGGGEASGTKEISINENGETTENVKAYASAKITVAVPNSYSESDEGKVVSNGALVAQGTQTYTDNGTYNTTLISSVVVAIPSASGVSF